MNPLLKSFSSSLLAFSLLSSQLLAAAQAPQSTSSDKQTPPPAAPPAAKPAPTFAFGVEDGTKVSLTLGRELSSAKEAAGNRVDFDVAEDVMVKDVVVIPKGAKAWGTILNAKPKRRLGRAGQLDVRIDEVRLADGERVPLRASQEAKGKGRGGAMTGGIIAAGVLFFPAAPLFLFMHGKDIVIAKGAPVTAYVDQDTPLDRSKFSPAPEAPAAPVPPATPAPSTPPSPAASPNPPDGPPHPLHSGWLPAAPY